MFCSECGAKHPRYLNYCPNDGQELIATLPMTVSHKRDGFCAGCGTQVDKAAQYCFQCGDSNSSMKFGTAKLVQQSKPAISKKTLSQSAVQSNKFSSNTLAAIFIPLAISILLVFAGALLLKNSTDNLIVDNSDGELTLGKLNSLEEVLSAELENDYDINVNFPSIYNIFTYISLMHGVDFEFEGKVLERYSDFFNTTISLNAQNFSSPLLIFTLFILILSGLALGHFTKRYDVPLWHSLTGFSILYGLFITISSYVANFKYENELESFYATLVLDFSGTFPLFESFFSGALLAFAITSISALLMMYRKQTFTYVKTLNSSLQYIFSTVLIALFGLIIFWAATLISLATNSYISEDFEYMNLQMFSIFSSFSMWVWDLSHFLPITLSTREYGETESYTLHLLSAFSDNQSELLGLFFESESFPLWMSLSFLLPVVLLGFAGYKLYETHKLKIGELAKFSIFYGVLLVIIKTFTSLKMSTSVTEIGQVAETFTMRIHSDFFTVFFLSALLAFICFSVGGFLKKYLNEA